ncbi:alpha/beta fold hydrolase [Bacillus sp. JCM 19041]|uniref:alpha/beta hydrolase n=1 Tax=Bacillus sp. JCM 19041 TaxID=1460637 RepID=UPI0006D08C3B
MKVVGPKPFMYKAGDRAVLLLHGFTGTTADVRKLGRFLEKKGYTCLGPMYRGHGEHPEKLKQSTPEEWWDDVVAGYRQLQNQGYSKIAVAGVSLGGAFALKLAIECPVVGVVSMCAPVKGKSEDDLYERVRAYSHSYFKIAGESEEEIEQSIKMPALMRLKELLDHLGEELPKIDVPLLVAQGQLDGDLYKESATRIYEQAKSKEKQLRWYNDSGHIITLDKEKDQVHKDVLEFLEELDWDEYS